MLSNEVRLVLVDMETSTPVSTVPEEPEVLLDVRTLFDVRRFVEVAIVMLLLPEPESLDDAETEEDASSPVVE